MTIPASCHGERRTTPTSRILASASASAIALAGAWSLCAAAPPRPQIITLDVERFYRLFDAAGGRPTATVLQHDYLEAGTPGLQQFVQARGLTGDNLAAAVVKEPEVFTKTKDCVRVLPGVKRRLQSAFEKLRNVYPSARFPPVTVLIGRNKTGGTTGADGVLIGLETLCNVQFLEPDLENRFVYLISHEYGHVQQPLAQVEDPNTSVLTGSVVEGGAEFLAELISGSVSYGQLPGWLRGREKEIETRFLADADKTDLSNWLYDGPGTPDHPADVGYWVGYRICKAYYQHHVDKRAAVAAILEVRDAHALLADSGWYPGIEIQ